MLCDSVYMNCPEQVTSVRPSKAALPPQGPPRLVCLSIHTLIRQAHPGYSSFRLRPWKWLSPPRLVSHLIAVPDSPMPTQACLPFN